VAIHDRQNDFALTREELNKTVKDTASTAPACVSRHYASSLPSWRPRLIRGTRYTRNFRRYTWNPSEHVALQAQEEYASNAFESRRARRDLVEARVVPARRRQRRN
jgi:hypothetical protein